MPRRYRTGSGGTIFHVLNRGARKARLFEDFEDYVAFLRVLTEAQERLGMRILSFHVMPNHWHLVIWPVGDDDLSTFMQWLTRTHAQRWQRARQSEGTGAVYQGRFRAIPVQDGLHLLTVCRYVERNALRAGLVDRAEDWPWGSAWKGDGAEPRPRLTAWPVVRPSNWLELLNKEGVETHLQELRDCVRRQIPFGDKHWRYVIAEGLGLEPTFRGRGRPRGLPPWSVGDESLKFDFSG